MENGNTTFNLLLMLSKNLTTVLLHSNFASLELRSSGSLLFSQAVLALGNIAFNYLQYLTSKPNSKYCDRAMLP